MIYGPDGTYTVEFKTAAVANTRRRVQDGRRREHAAPNIFFRWAVRQRLVTAKRLY
jgi:hypothetical protein